MRILVIGGGGREHALAWKLAQSPRVDKIYCAPGNPGIAAVAELVAIDINDSSALLAFAWENKIDLTVVGPEVPLVNGLVNLFSEHGLRASGPSQAAAQLEGSKEFAKRLMQKYHIPTADFTVCSSAREAQVYIKEHGAPIVVKANGLAAGKGVVVAMSEAEALDAVHSIMDEHAFGAAGNTVVLEECLFGEEASLLAFTDGSTIIPMVAAQDHKRIFDGDKGPNTGGMGAYAPAPVITLPIREQVMREILQPIVDAMRAEGTPYTGCLYAGLMITDKGPKVIEFNARFGDPETQAVLPLLESDLVDIMEACCNGTLTDTLVKWREGAAVCVVASAQGYPGKYRSGEVITGTKEAEQTGAMVFHAGTELIDGRLVTGGGRVLGVTAVGSDISCAITQAYQAVDKISFPGMFFRKDIAYRAAKRKAME